MQDDGIARFPTLAVRLAALWVLVVAGFKLFSASPNDLPPVVLAFALPGFDPGPGLTLRLAVSIELLVAFTALLRPRWGWPWLAALYAAFLAVLVLTGRELQAAAAEPVTLTAAMFDADASCGCFGSRIKIPPGYMLAVDGALLLLLLAGRPWRGRLATIGPEWLPTGASIVAVVLPWMVISSAKSVPPTPTEGPVAAGGANGQGGGEEGPRAPEGPDGPSDPGPVAGGAGSAPDPAGAPVELQLASLRWVELSITGWEGQMVYDLAFDPAPEDPDSQPVLFWSFFGLEEEAALLPLDAMVVLYRRSCDHCAEHVRGLAADPPLSGDGLPLPLVFLELPEDGDPQDIVQPEQFFPPGTGLSTYLTLPRGPQYVFTTPGEFRLEGGVVVAPREAIGSDE